MLQSPTAQLSFYTFTQGLKGMTGLIWNHSDRVLEIEGPYKLSSPTVPLVQI